MGCAPSKQLESKTSSPTAKITPLNVVTLQDKKAVAKAAILDSIKRSDIILFEKTIHQYEISPNEIIGPLDQMKTILHYIAEANFADSMSLAIEYIQSHEPKEIVKILNVKDSNGNTPAIACCIFDSTETLDILLRTGYVNLGLKNNMGQTALIAAQDNDSTCVNILSNPSNTRESSRANYPSSQNMMNSSLIGNSPKVQSNSKRNSINKDEITPANNGRSSLQLRSVHSLRKEVKLATDTKLYKLLAELQPNEEFLDEEFAHDNDAICNEETFPYYLNTYGPIKWTKLSKLPGFDTNTLALFEGIDIPNVANSLLAGSDLYSALAIMTEFPQRLLKVFCSKEANKQGAYSVKFLVSGIPVEILLDEYVPCLAKDNQALFGRPASNEIWFPMIEKAFAKLYGGYHDVRTLPITEALETMTGMPTSQVALKDAEVDEIWELLQDCDKRNLIYCAGLNQVGEEKTNRIFNIVRLCETEQYRIIKLRNHFNDFTWQGDFSDGSELWTKELKEEVGHYTGEKNCFYMKVSEFVRKFDHVTVCHYYDSWNRSSKEVSTNCNKAAFFELELEREMEVILSVHQKLPRFVDDEAYEISPVEIVVGEEIDDGEAIKKVAHGEKDAFELAKPTTFACDKIRLKLSEGKYRVRVKVRWVDEEKHDFTFNAFSQYPLTLRKGKAQDNPDFLERIYLDTGSRSGDRYQLGNRCEFGSSWCGSHLWLYGVNRGTKTWNLEIVFNKLENLRLCKKYRSEDNVLKLVIPPKGQGVGFVKRINTKPFELNWNFNQSWV